MMHLMKQDSAVKALPRLGSSSISALDIIHERLQLRHIKPFMSSLNFHSIFEGGV